MDGINLSPLHTVQKKKGCDDKRRVVLDLSFPMNSSVNAGIPEDSYLGQYFVIEYPSVVSLAELIVQHHMHPHGGCWMLKHDLSSMYRQVYFLV